MAGENQENQNNTFKKPSIHTLEGDLMNAVKDENYSSNIVKIAANARTQASTEEETAFKGSDKSFLKKIFLIIGGVIVVSIAVLFFVLYGGKTTPKATNTDTDPVPATTSSSTPQTIQRKTLIEAEAVLQTDLNNFDKIESVEKIKNIQNQLRDRNINEKATVEIDTKLSTVDFFLKNRFSGEERLLESLGSAYTFGLYNNSNDVFETFILVKVSSFDTAFTSMINWEPYMRYDLQDMFNDYTASSTENISYSSPSGSVFKDRLLKNTDTRVDADQDGSIHLVYGFINKEYLLITSGTESFLSVRDRLLNKNTLR